MAKKQTKIDDATTKPMTSRRKTAAKSDSAQSPAASKRASTRTHAKHSSRGTSSDHEDTDSKFKMAAEPATIQTRVTRSGKLSSPTKTRRKRKATAEQPSAVKEELDAKQQQAEQQDDEQQRPSSKRARRAAPTARAAAAKRLPSGSPESVPDVEEQAAAKEKPEDGSGQAQPIPAAQKESAHQEASGRTSGITKMTINRAPVLTLWVAVVAEREGYSFEEGLTFGKAIAGMYAQAKGRAIGVYELKEEEPEARRRRKEMERQGAETVEVFGTTLWARKVDGKYYAISGGKIIYPGPVRNYLLRAFGDEEHLAAAKAAMEELACRHSPDEIGKAAYHLYEQFRPVVPPGLHGWGRKGVLDLDKIRSLTAAAA